MGIIGSVEEGTNSSCAHAATRKRARVGAPYRIREFHKPMAR